MLEYTIETADGKRMIVEVNNEQEETELRNWVAICNGKIISVEAA